VDNINPMEALLWILLPGFVALASGLLSWFIMQSRMEVKLAEQREMLATERGALDAEKVGVRMSLENAVRAAEEGAKRQALDSFLSELTIEQRHYTRENRLLMHSRKSLVLQERMYFRNIPLSDWIEHEIVMEEGQDVTRLVQDMTIFDREVVSIAEASRPKRQLA
jgi:BioD-like phosphotransacetylase family protein